MTPERMLELVEEYGKAAYGYGRLHDRPRHMTPGVYLEYVEIASEKRNRAKARLLDAIGQLRGEAAQERDS